MPDYKIEEDPWPELVTISAEAFGGNRAGAGLPVALDVTSEYLFRDLAGRVAHRYPLAEAKGIDDLRHYLSYAAMPATKLYGRSSAKNGFLTAVMMTLRRLALVRRSVTVLEVGSTIGENYDLLRHFIGIYRLSLTLEFVGIDRSESLSTFARAAHRGDKAFTAITDDGAAGLARFPDRSFDLVLCNGVANFTEEPVECFRGMARVCRVAMVLSLQMTEGSETIWRTDAKTQKPFFIPTRRALDELWRSEGTFHDYLIARLAFSSAVFDAGGTGFFLGDQTGLGAIQFERHVVSRYPLFPAADAVRRLVA